MKRTTMPLSEIPLYLDVMLPKRVMRVGFPAIRTGILVAMISLTTSVFAQAELKNPSLETLMFYHGSWSVRAAHPWSGAKIGAIDHLTSKCQLFTVYVACEQTVNDKPLAIIVYSLGAAPMQFYTRTVGPDGLAGARGGLTMDGHRWTYLDKPSAGMTGPWSRVENEIVNRDRILFKEYESSDNGKQWTLTNSGTEERVKP
ncbi:MAG: hypothetical protein ABI866_04845 [Dokdonella sp.]